MWHRHFVVNIENYCKGERNSIRYDCNGGGDGSVLGKESAGNTGGGDNNGDYETFE